MRSGLGQVDFVRLDPGSELCLNAVGDHNAIADVSEYGSCGKVEVGLRHVGGGLLEEGLTFFI